MTEENKAQNQAAAGAGGRAFDRYPVRDDALLSLVGQDLSVQCSVLDLSLGGCRLRAKERFRAESQVPVEVTFTLRGLPLLLPGVIQWTDFAENFGIRFLDMRSRRKEALEEVLAEIAALHARRLASGGAVRRKTEIPAEGQRRAESQAADELTAAVYNHERRAHPRHSIGTTAVITVTNTGGQLRGWLLDLSLSGCRVRTDEPSELSAEARVSAELLLGGVLVYANGVVEANEDQHNLRIRFLDMNDSQREKVGKLIEQLQPPHGATPGSQGESAGR
jgi:hypothetical protein